MILLTDENELFIEPPRTPYRRVVDVTQLREEIEAGHNEYFIRLNGGIRSSKYIEIGDEKNTFYILNLIDDTEQTLTYQEIMDDSLDQHWQGHVSGGFLCGIGGERIGRNAGLPPASIL